MSGISAGLADVAKILSPEVSLHCSSSAKTSSLGALGLPPQGTRNEMDTEMAILWNLDTIDEEINRESIDWDAESLLEGGPESLLTPDLRKRVDEVHYATGGKYRGKLSIAHIEVVIPG